MKRCRSFVCILRPISCFPSPAPRPSTMASSTRWSWWPLTRWWTCPLMGGSLPQWTALGQCGPSTGRLHYTWGVGALSRTHLPPLQALLTTTLLSITTPPPSLCHHRNQPLPSTMQPFNPILPPPTRTLSSTHTIMTVFVRAHTVIRPPCAPDVTNKWPFSLQQTKPEFQKRQITTYNVPLDNPTHLHFFRVCKVRPLVMNMRTTRHSLFLRLVLYLHGLSAQKATVFICNMWCSHSWS